MRSRVPNPSHPVRLALFVLFAGTAPAWGADPAPPPASPDTAAPPAEAVAAPPGQAIAAPPRPTVDAATMQRASALVYSRDVQRARAANSIDEVSATAGRIQRVAQRLILPTIRVNPNLRWAFAITVENEAIPVAYCLPGGRIIASTALIDRMRLTDDELAVVLAHAIAHAVAGHDADLAAQRLARSPNGIAADPNRTVLNLAEVLAQIVHTEPHGVDAERAADGISLDLLLRAGFDPRVAIEAWRKVARAGGAVPPGFLALNPTWPGRPDEIDAAVPAAIKAYQASLTPPAPPPAAPKAKKGKGQKAPAAG